MTYLVSSFYKFVPLTALPEKKKRWYGVCEELQVKGTILLAEEGINATIAGLPDGITTVVSLLQAEPEIDELTLKQSWSQIPPFQRLKVKIKKEIVTLGRPEIDPTYQVGVYVSPQEWNQLLQDPDVVVIDTRNDYEVAMGTFTGAINPDIPCFRNFPDYVHQHLDPDRHRKVAMFCTGGIRCEKATALMLSQGFQNVYHLQGGILNYLAEIPAEQSQWQGECFVFDERTVLGPTSLER